MPSTRNYVIHGWSWNEPAQRRCRQSTVDTNSWGALSSHSVILIYSPPSRVTGVSSRPCFFLFSPFKSINANYLINDYSYLKPSRPRHSQVHKTTLWQRSFQCNRVVLESINTHTYIQKEFYNIRDQVDHDLQLS